MGDSAANWSLYSEWQGKLTSSQQQWCDYQKKYRENSTPEKQIEIITLSSQQTEQQTLPPAVYNVLFPGLAGNSTGNSLQHSPVMSSPDTRSPPHYSPQMFTAQDIVTSQSVLAMLNSLSVPQTQPEQRSNTAHAVQEVPQVVEGLSEEEAQASDWVARTLAQEFATGAEISLNIINKRVSAAPLEVSAVLGRGLTYFLQRHPHIFAFISPNLVQFTPPEFPPDFWLEKAAVIYLQRQLTNSPTIWRLAANEFETVRAAAHAAKLAFYLPNFDSFIRFFERHSDVFALKPLAETPQKLVALKSRSDELFADITAHCSQVREAAGEFTPALAADWLHWSLSRDTELYHTVSGCVSRLAQAPADVRLSDVEEIRRMLMSQPEVFFVRSELVALTSRVRPSTSGKRIAPDSPELIEGPEQKQQHRTARSDDALEEEKKTLDYLRVHLNPSMDVAAAVSTRRLPQTFWTAASSAVSRVLKRFGVEGFINRHPEAFVPLGGGQVRLRLFVKTEPQLEAEALEFFANFLQRMTSPRRQREVWLSKSHVYQALMDASPELRQHLNTTEKLAEFLLANPEVFTLDVPSQMVALTERVRNKRLLPPIPLESGQVAGALRFIKGSLGASEQWVDTDLLEEKLSVAPLRVAEVVRVCGGLLPLLRRYPTDFALKEEDKQVMLVSHYPSNHPSENDEQAMYYALLSIESAPGKVLALSDLPSVFNECAPPDLVFYVLKTFGDFTAFVTSRPLFFTMLPHLASVTTCFDSRLDIDAFNFTFAKLSELFASPKTVVKNVPWRDAHKILLGAPRPVLLYLDAMPSFKRFLERFPQVFIFDPTGQCISLPGYADNDWLDSSNGSPVLES